MRTLFISAVIFFAAMSLIAQPGGAFNLAEVPAITSVADAVLLDLRQFVTTNQPLTIEVEVFKDVVYVERDGVELHLNILYPKGTTAPLPTIVYVPGSAWMKQNMERSIPVFSRFAARGYVIALVEYRHTGIAPFPAQVQDAKTAIRFMRKNASKYHVDSNNVFVWGDSSGGHTALFVGFTQGSSAVADTDTYKEFPDKVNAIIDFFGPTELLAMSDPPSTTNHNLADAPEGRLIGGLNLTENPDKARAASPVFYVTKNAPPTLVAHGDRDLVVILSQSDIIAKELNMNIMFFKALDTAPLNSGQTRWAILSKNSFKQT
jgi:acetyl esterase/lipase